MGHKLDRPLYGEKGSLQFRRKVSRDSFRFRSSDRLTRSRISTSVATCLLMAASSALSLS